MTCVATHNLVRQRPGDKRYVPGPMLYELGLTVPAYFQFQAACHPRLLEISAQTGWVVFLALRSGDETVCVDRVGSTSVNILNAIGRRVPLAGSALGVAMLLSLPARKQKRALRASIKVLRGNPAYRERTYGAMWQRSKRLSMGLNLGDILPGGASLGVPILHGPCKPVAAISVAGPLAEFTERRVVATSQMLTNIARRIESEQRELIVDLASG